VLGPGPLDEVRRNAELAIQEELGAVDSMGADASVRVCAVDGRARRGGAALRRRRPRGRVVNLGDEGSAPSMRSARTSTTTWTRGRWTWTRGTIECPKHGSTFDLANRQAERCRRSSRSMFPRDRDRRRRLIEV
jgi:hypothetical protein